MRKEVIKAILVVFIASFCTMVIELVAGRIMAPYVGVSLYTWTSIIGVVLAGISIGAYVGGMLADRFPTPKTLGWLLFVSGLAALSIAPLTEAVARFPLQTSLMMRILFVTTVIFFLPACLLGMISPVVVRLSLDRSNGPEMWWAKSTLFPPSDPSWGPLPPDFSSSPGWGRATSSCSCPSS